MTDFAIETYDRIVNDVKPLLTAQYDETATYKDIPLDPNFTFYAQANEYGLVRFYTARDDGALVGYAVVVVNKRHSQYDHPWATSNLFWVRPDRRGSGVGRGLVRFIKENLLGYVLQMVSSVDHPELAALLASEGFAPVEVVHSIRL